MSIRSNIFEIQESIKYQADSINAAINSDAFSSLGDSQQAYIRSLRGQIMSCLPTFESLEQIWPNPYQELE